MSDDEEKYIPNPKDGQKYKLSTDDYRRQLDYNDNPVTPEDGIFLSGFVGIIVTSFFSPLQTNLGSLIAWWCFLGIILKISEIGLAFYRRPIVKKILDEIYINDRFQDAESLNRPAYNLQYFCWFHSFLIVLLMIFGRVIF